MFFLVAGLVTLISTSGLLFGFGCAGFALVVFVFRADIAWLVSGRPEPPNFVWNPRLSPRDGAIEQQG